jgi:hypothetical protein
LAFLTASHAGITKGKLMSHAHSFNTGREPSLTPLEAIETWLHDDPDRSETCVLEAAIQRDRRIDLDGDEIASIILDARHDRISARDALDRLMIAAQDQESGHVRIERLG